MILLRDNLRELSDALSGLKENVYSTVRQPTDQNVYPFDPEITIVAEGLNVLPSEDNQTLLDLCVMSC